MVRTESYIHKNIRISGRVQGVGFRYATQNMASYCHVTGYVRNLPEGEVLIEAEGTPDDLEAFICWCRQGPSRAVIKFIDVYDGAMVGFTEFVVK